MGLADVAETLSQREFIGDRLGVLQEAASGRYVRYGGPFRRPVICARLWQSLTYDVIIGRVVWTGRI